MKMRMFFGLDVRQSLKEDVESANTTNKKLK